MISRIRNSIFTKILWGFMGLYLLNISVDTPDPNPNYIPEDLSFNDQESIIEIVVEQFLGYDNAFEEYDDHDTEEHNKKKNVKIDFLVNQAFPSESPRQLFIKKKRLFLDHEARLTNGFNEIDSPPPKA
ncbi:hypothetical protein GQ41_3211 [Arenibacter algicola]|uniref:Uncharacterized protein n=2 Tax=Arenibacter algicola TaxID=616991 RepID=A0ABY3AHN6_9FLAO